MRYDVLAGLDPRTSFELMGWQPGGRTVIDLTPPFKSRPLRGGRRRSVTISEGIAMVTGRKPTEREQLATWLERGQDTKVMSALNRDVEMLRDYWRFGVIHGGVLRKSEWVLVDWNVTQDIGLGSALRWCLEDQRPVSLFLRDGRVGLFTPEQIEWLARYGEDNLAHGYWSDGRHEVLAFSDVADCHYPYSVSAERVSHLL